MSEQATLPAFCQRLLESPALCDKLVSPRLASGAQLPDSSAAGAAPPARPARAPEIAFVSGAAALPRPLQLGSAQARARCLARFAHHELCAVELLAWALLRWPLAPPGLRRSWVSVLEDEQRHCRLYLERLAAQGSSFEQHPGPGYFWRVAEVSDSSPLGARAFLAALGLTLEQANLDFSALYADGFAAAGDAASAAVCREVQCDEIRHVRVARRWLLALDPAADGDLAAYQRAVPFPFSAARAKGRRFDAAARRAAGLSPALIETVRRARSSQEQAASTRSEAKPSGERVGPGPARPGAQRGAAERSGVVRAVPGPGPQGLPSPLLIPNLGAEEGPGWQARLRQPAVAWPARLWRCLFPATARFPAELPPLPWAPGIPECADFALRDLDRTRSAFAWLADAPAQHSAAACGAALDEVDAAAQRHCHDKAFAQRFAAERGLEPECWRGLTHCYEPEVLRESAVAERAILAEVARWPSWTRGRFTLKPRFGSSGRGRAAGTLDAPSRAWAAALPRLAARGGALLEPWVLRSADLAAELYVAADAGVTLLGTLAQETTRAGLPRGHRGWLRCGGGVDAGSPFEAELASAALALAGAAAAAGFRGACGVDAFAFLGPGGAPAFRPLVEFNARFTMGHVALGILARVLGPSAAEPPAAFAFRLAPANAPSAGPVACRRLLFSKAESAAGAPQLEIFGPACSSG